jgi:predicted ATPase/DNA-binding SARP family transcriptional activator
MIDASAPTAQWRISLLGGVRITDASGAQVDPGPAKCQELLAALALEPQVAITVGRLVGLLWGESPPRTAEKTLQTYVARLRKAIGSEAIVRTGSAYRLDVDPASIDTFRFRSALKRGDIEVALQEWAGEPLAGVDADGLRPLFDGLVEEWLDAVEAALEQAVEADPGAATGRLTELVAAHPFREGLWALLMTALYRTGRQAEALGAYRRARAALVDELGVEPGPRLRELEQLILGQDEQLVAGVEPRHGRRADGPVPTGTITFGFVELDDAAALWSEHPDHAADVISTFEEIAKTVAGDHRGLVFAGGAETIGVAFDRAADAAGWSIALHRSLSAHEWPDRAPIDVRVGLHTGDADERNGSYYGPAVTMAKRVAALGHPGQTIATSVAATLCGLTEQSELGTFALEGVRAEHSLHQIGSGSFPPLRIATQRHDELPRPANRLIGRDGLVSTVSAALADAPIVTLVGPGGIGKTRLALEVARRDRNVSLDGVWFVSLAEVAESKDVARAVADALGVHESSEQSVLDAIVGALRNRTGLIILDNCEHVVDGTNQLLLTLVERCPHLTVLATSREGLGVPAEQLIVVGPLDICDASVELFVQRALVSDHTFDGELHRNTINAVCRRLDGVPLAIELAAARVRSLTPADLLARLDDSFSLLTGPRRGTIERHRTLRATIQWSYDLLSEQEQRLFRRLAVFSGPFDLIAAERVVPDEHLPAGDVTALIGDLVDQSMCTVESGTAGRRFRLLEPMRQFALDELALDESDRDLRRRHADHVCDQIVRIRRLLAGPREIDGVAELTEIWPNLRSAVDWAIDRNDLSLATDLVGPIVSQGFLRRGLGELRDWIERIMEIAGPDDEDAIADGLLWTATFYLMTESRSDFDRLIDRFGEPDLILARFARLVMDRDEFAVVVAAPEAIAEARRRGDTLLAHLLEVFVAGNLISSGRLDEAESYANGVVQRVEGTMPPTFLNWLQYIIATVRAIRGDAAGADAIYDRIASMPLPPRTNSPNETLAARRAFRTGDHQSAYAILANYIDELLVVGNLSGAGVVGLEFVNMMVGTEQLAEAAFMLGYYESNGVLDVDGDGFKVLLVSPGMLVDADPRASQLRSEAAARQLTPRDALEYMADTLDRLTKV